MNVIDRNEFDVAVELHRHELQVHCYRLMGSIYDAEDMVQETFLKAWRHRDMLDVQASLRAWLYKIATNTCLDALKRHKRRFVPMTQEGASTLAEPIPAPVRENIWLGPYPDALLDTAADVLATNADPGDDPYEYVAERHNITMAFIAALHLLPPRQRAVLILRDVMEWQAEEVAALLNTTNAAVKSALHRARTTLVASGYTPDAISTVTLDQSAQQQLNAYMHAWETADVDGLIALLKEDATFSMPPIPSWYRGRTTIGELVARTIFSGQAAGRWHLLPTRANGQIAFGLYRQTESAGRYAAYGIQLLSFDGRHTSDITTFQDPRLFSYFDLPPVVEVATQG